MRDLISRSALGIGKCNPAVFEDKGYARGWNAVVDLLEASPSVDAVEVVRCFYCRHWQEPRSEKTIPWCNHLKTVMHASDFCNYGQRRGDGDGA